MPQFMRDLQAFGKRGLETLLTMMATCLPGTYCRSEADYPSRAFAWVDGRRALVDVYHGADLPLFADSGP